MSKIDVLIKISSSDVIKYLDAVESWMKENAGHILIVTILNHSSTYMKEENFFKKLLPKISERDRSIERFLFAENRTQLEVFVDKYPIQIDLIELKLSYEDSDDNYSYNYAGSYRS